MTAELTFDPGDFRSRLRTLLGLQGEVLTDQELSQLAEFYPRCRGRETWDVRQYVGHTGLGAGAREYRVVRGGSVQSVFRTPERVRAAAVGSALNELESQDKPKAGDKQDKQTARVTPAAG